MAKELRGAITEHQPDLLKTLGSGDDTIDLVPTLRAAVTVVAALGQQVNAAQRQDALRPVHDESDAALFAARRSRAPELEVRLPAVARCFSIHSMADSQ